MMCSLERYYSNGDELFYEWQLTSGALAGFNYDDLNGNGLYDFGEPFVLDGGDEIFYDTDLGDHYVTGPEAIMVPGSGDNGIDLELLMLEIASSIFFSACFFLI